MSSTYVLVLIDQVKHLFKSFNMLVEQDSPLIEIHFILITVYFCLIVHLKMN